MPLVAGNTPPVAKILPANTVVKAIPKRRVLIRFISFPPYVSLNKFIHRRRDEASSDAMSRLVGIYEPNIGSRVSQLRFEAENVPFRDSLRGEKILRGSETRYSPESGEIESLDRL